MWVYGAFFQPLSYIMVPKVWVTVSIEHVFCMELLVGNFKFVFEWVRGAPLCGGPGPH